MDPSNMEFLVGSLKLTVKILFQILQYIYYLIFPVVHSLRDEIAVVTGAGSGIGRLISLRLAERGAVVVLWDVNTQGARAVADEIKNMGGKAFVYHCDVTDRHRVYELADQVRNEVGPVTMLFNNAGIVTGRKFLDTPDEMNIKTMEVNTIAHFWTVKAFLPYMMEINHGYVITIASMAGWIGVPAMADYCASKFAAVGFDESLRNELKKLGKTGVHTTCVCPSFINTGMFDGIRVKFPDIFPMVEPEWAADQIIRAVETHSPVLIMPRSSYIAPICRGILPAVSFDAIAEFCGMHETMDDFKGRASTEKALR